MAPLTLSNLHIESGQKDGDQSERSFSAITAENMLFMQNCTLVAHQGSAIVANGLQAHVILQNCTIQPRFYCCWSRESRLIWESCFDNVILMNELCAVGFGTDLISVDECIVVMKANGSTFDPEISWPYQRNFGVEQ